jgi:hypothetical protein
MQNETQDLQLHQNQALQKPPANGVANTSDEQKLAQAIALDPLIKDRPEIDIVEYLRYCFALTGLQSDRFPDQVQTAVLIQFIRDEFGLLRMAEIKLAFTMGVAGRLEVDMRHFQVFSPEYVGRIMSAYKAWRVQTAKQQAQAAGTIAPLPALPAPESPDLKYQAINGQYAAFLMGAIPWEDFPLWLYADAVKAIPWSENHYTQYEADVRRDAIRKIEAMILVEPKREKELTGFKAGVLRGEYVKRITELCKCWSIKVWFEQNQKLGDQTLFEKV